MTLTIDIERINDYAKIPTKGTQGAACFDLYASEDTRIGPANVGLVRTGLRVRVPDGYVLEVVPRSGLALKEGVTVYNSPGQVDSDYRGELGVVLYNADTYYGKTVRCGDRIAQCRILPVPQVTFVETTGIGTDETDRGEGGYGHTG